MTAAYDGRDQASRDRSPLSVATDLPIHAVLPALKQALRASPAAVLSAPPGSGKTTIVPLALLDEPWLAGRKILMLEPRRLAARAAATRMASLRGDRVGDGVGFRVRLESKVSARTRVEVLTEGILTRRIQRDPELDGVGLVIFDEFHERNLQGDLALALCLEVQQGLREDLRLLVMSATLDAEPIARLLAGPHGSAPVITADGGGHAVETTYLDRDPPREGMVRATVAAVRDALRETRGDLLVFLPGGSEIRRTLTQLQADLPPDTVVRPLYGELGREQQDQALTVDPDGRRRVVLATDIAETSLTIAGVSVVIDSGLARRPHYDPNTALTRLVTRRVSRASATQRAGRAGRLGPGTCYRLWSKATHRGLVARDQAEILQADLTPLVLELATWGSADSNDLAWLDPPPRAALSQASALLRQLDALDGADRPTARGRAMAELPLHPRLAHMLLEAHRQGCGEQACRVAALLSERDIVGRGGRDFGVDIEARLRVLQAQSRTASRGERPSGQRAGQRAGRPSGTGIDGYIDTGASRQVMRLARQWQQLLARGATPAPPRRVPARELPSVGGLLAWAYPDRVAQRSAGDPCRYRLANGRAALLSASDPLQGEEWLVIAQLDAGQGDGRVFLAAALDIGELRSRLATHITRRQVVEWSPREQAVRWGDEERLGALVLGLDTGGEADPEAVRAAMLHGLRGMGLRQLPWTAAATALRTRVMNAREWQPEAGWPDLSDAALEATLEDWLAPYLTGISRRAHLQRLDLEAVLKARLDWQQQQTLERLLPTHLRVPSGSRVALEYRLDGPPVLAARIQELFGQAESPRVCDNRIPVVVQLLSPARRPVQVTRDLAGFWQRTYFEVRKELRGRYPKHYWPDDPATATATARVRPRN